MRAELQIGWIPAVQGVEFQPDVTVQHETKNHVCSIWESKIFLDNVLFEAKNDTFLGQIERKSRSQNLRFSAGVVVQDDLLSLPLAPINIAKRGEQNPQDVGSCSSDTHAQKPES